MLPGQQVFDELPLVVDPVLQFPILGPKLVRTRPNPLDRPAQSRCLRDVKTDVLAVSLSFRNPSLKPLTPPAQTIETFFFFIHDDPKRDSAGTLQRC